MSYNVLVTAGSTVVMIDKVRAITNIFKGKTGTAIAEYFSGKGGHVTLVTSNPAIAKRLEPKVRVISYKTYDDLKEVMAKEIRGGEYDVVIHSSAVSDYLAGGVFAKNDKEELSELDSSKKVSSRHEELFLRLVPTEKLVDKIRGEWGFNGILVKFKLEVNINDEELIEIAQRSQTHSKANIIVANCLEWSSRYAYAIDEYGPQRVSRRKLPQALYDQVLRSIDDICLGHSIIYASYVPDDFDKK